MVGTQVNLKASLLKFFGFENFRGQQEKIIQNLLDGNNTFVIMPTGGGKSMCYQLPALVCEGTAIIVSPLIALMKNQVDAIRNNHENESVAHVFNSTLTKTEANQVKEDVKNGITKMLFVAPESLTKQDNIAFLKSVKISFFAIDEAHCISEWGHDFRPEYRRLRSIFEAIEKVPIIALTATATEKVQLDIQKNLNMMDATVFKDSFNRPNLFYEVRPKKDVTKEIIKYIKKRPDKSGVVYCLSRKKVEEVAENLQLNGIKALPYHAGLEPKVRAKHQDMFLMEDVDVIVATIAFGMGIDKPDIRFVIHHDIPKSLESYYQETGRAGRDGGEGECVTFYNYKDIEKLEKFLSNKQDHEKEVGHQLLDEMVSFAETSVCRRKYILHYFGEDFDDSKCTNMCDNCKNPIEKEEGKEEITLLLKTILSVKEQFKAKHIVNILSGKINADIQNFKHHQSPHFGSGKKHNEAFWNAVIRQALIAKILNKNIEKFGLLSLSKLGHEFLTSPYSFLLSKERNYSDAADDQGIITNQKSGGATDETLLLMLKDLRKKISKEKQVPPFVIFQDPSLEEMAIQYPINLEELTHISGVGKGKASKFGLPFTNLIKQYVTDNEIERPEDIQFKTVAKKSGNKVKIIMNIDRKLPLEDIADTLKVSIDDLISEIETIVASGTKVDINYYLNDILDEDSQEDIFEYFSKAETDTIEDALEDFEDDFTEEELRLVRIKFMSEIAN